VTGTIVPLVSSAGNGRSYRTLSPGSLRYDRRLYQYHESIVWACIPWHSRVDVVVVADRGWLWEERERVQVGDRVGNREQGEALYSYGVVIAMEAVVEVIARKAAVRPVGSCFGRERWRSRR
jgi:hypothetical protein